MKYNPNDFEGALKEDMEEVERCYTAWKKDPNDSTYWNLKEAVWYLSLTLKQVKISGYLSPTEIAEMNEYYWGLWL